ncbi:helix-turn-helix transcriptional regulator [Paenibacillus sp. FSL K6-3166]|uniref:helix-turn-helix transcriptional regulator n=1 Tax=unclassified Paenibacillus TaxID=185978 RepID=UPI000BA10BBC|nr:helix-turn-helix transcriptional regulator [Paenibacillus sp. VTT E-133291]OZQ95820.1 transcriptional regulator [Paenibacillus sp. VTT E-133291]
MKYSEMLKDSIRKEKLTLNEISERLENLGRKTNKIYISKLQNGKLPPASDNLNDALAKILNIDPVELMAAAYREKIPPEVLKRLCTSA